MALSKPPALLTRQGFLRSLRSTFMMSPNNRAQPGPQEPLSAISRSTINSRNGLNAPIQRPRVKWGRVLLHKGILERITALLDLESMFELARTCRSLNDMILPPYITQFIPEDRFYAYVQGQGHLGASEYHPTGVLTALRCSVTLRHTVKSIAYCFDPNDGIERVIQDLREMATLFRRQPHPLRNVSLHFWHMDDAAKHGELQTSPRVTPTLFRDMVCRVLATAADYGATVLEVEYGWDFFQSLPGGSSTSEGSEASGSPGVPNVHLGPRIVTCECLSGSAGGG